MEITQEYLKETCKMGQGNDCCRYIIVHPEDGFVCGKEEPDIKSVLDERVDNLSMTARGDNCEGWNATHPSQD